MMIQKIDELKDEHIKELRKELERVKSDLITLGALKIILFGSAARGELGLFSDIDLIVIMESNKDFIKRGEDIYKKVQPAAVDILTYTPEEFNRMKRDNLFIQHIAKEGKVIFERNK